LAGFLGIGYSAQNMVLQTRMANLQDKLQNSQELTQKYEVTIAEQKKEKKELMQHALAELKQRSKAIESILSTVGVKIHIKESNDNTGGPYKSPMESRYDDLTLKVDQYLETIQFIPLGAPVPGTITSKFGKRVDPFNGRMGFHEGLDIRNHLGTKVMATADGVVVAKGYAHGLGNYVVLDHGNHFRTRFLHLRKSVVKRGERVTRGEYIGNLGSTGRSTGPHLHYEIRYRGKPVNPLKFMRIAKYISLNNTK
jgi:murein DD-endopeptidase MepM/ murein hydrolase activator NlpD